MVATSGHGLISTANLFDDVKELMAVLVDNYVYQISGHNHYKVEWTPRDWCTPTTKPIIYMHGLTIMEREQLDICTYKQNIQFNMGVKQVKGKTKGFGRQISALSQVFNPYRWGELRFSYTFKGVDFVGVRMTEIGIDDPDTGGMLEFQDNDVKEFYYEWTNSLSLRFKIRI